MVGSNPVHRGWKSADALRTGVPGWRSAATGFPFSRLRMPSPGAPAVSGAPPALQLPCRPAVARTAMPRNPLSGPLCSTRRRSHFSGPLSRPSTLRRFHRFPSLSKTTSPREVVEEQRLGSGVLGWETKSALVSHSLPAVCACCPLFFFSSFVLRLATHHETAAPTCLLPSQAAGRSPTRSMTSAHTGAASGTLPASQIRGENAQWLWEG